MILPTRTNIESSSRLSMRSRSSGVESQREATSELQQMSDGDAISRVDFGDVLSEAVDGIRSAFKESGQANEDALLGKGSPHSAMIAMSKAGLVFRFAVQTRNKVIDAYREMMNMQV